MRILKTKSIYKWFLVTTCLLSNSSNSPRFVTIHECQTYSKALGKKSMGSLTEIMLNFSQHRVMKHTCAFRYLTAIYTLQRFSAIKNDYFQNTTIDIQKLHHAEVFRTATALQALHSTAPVRTTVFNALDAQMFIQ